MPEAGRTPDSRTREAYESGELYAPQRICLKPKQNASAYTDRLLAEKLSLVTHYYSGGPMLDLCCAVGEHLFEFASGIDAGFGLDFSRRYIETAARATKEHGINNLAFVQGDAKTLPFKSDTFALVYSLSSLYAIPNVHLVVDEVARVLKPGGIAVLDLGNRRSINTYCLTYYTDWPQTFPITVGEMRSFILKAGLHVIEHRCFQILPLWAGLPKHLWPLIHPGWQNIMRRRIAGRMIDEWLSSLPLVRTFAFRHLFVCRKAGS